MNLYDSLLKYSEAGYYPMHMPGHKRNSSLLAMCDPYSIDITEIDDFDNLHRPEGILKAGMEAWSELYNSRKAYYLVGGSSAGILTGISACTRRGDKVLVARNCHKSVYHALYLRGLEPVYLYPPVVKKFDINGGVSVEQVEEHLKSQVDIKLIIITSPTYEGIVSDIRGIAAAAHSYGIPLMVDEAHGAHLGFHKGFPETAVRLGADVVVHSIHKTLPAFTQTALLHINGELVEEEKIERYLSIYQSSSPSYILMSGIEKCLELLINNGSELFECYDKMLSGFYQEAEEFKNIRILTDNTVTGEGFYRFDPSKLVLSVKGTNMTGKELYEELLHTYKVQMEMVSKDYVLGMTSIGDRQEGFDRLLTALREIDGRLKKEITTDSIMEFEPPEAVMSCEEALNAPLKEVLLSNSEGFISGEYVYLYPPGIPLLVPGERIEKDLLKQIISCRKQGLSLQGLTDYSGNTIKVIS